MKKRIRLFIVTGTLIGAMAFGGAAMAYPGEHSGAKYSNWTKPANNYTYNYSHNHMQDYSYGHMQHNGAGHNYGMWGNHE